MNKTQSLYVPMLISGFSVMAGVSLKNTDKKLWGQDLQTSGIALFIGGWILAIAAFHYRYKSEYLNFQPIAQPIIALPVIGIVLAAMFMNMKMKKKEEVPMYLPIMFIVSWLAFVGMIAMASSTYIPFIAALLVFFSMMWLLPKERKAGVADGMGMTMFYIAFIILASVMGRQ
jgi:hypothetical protein